jgi:hypothetical protein
VTAVKMTDAKVSTGITIAIFRNKQCQWIGVATDAMDRLRQRSSDRLTYTAVAKLLQRRGILVSGPFVRFLCSRIAISLPIKRAQRA